MSLSCQRSKNIQMKVVITGTAKAWRRRARLDEQELRQKLRKIEALFAGAATPGERDAADAARDRIRARLREFEHTERPEEWRFALENPWSRRLFVALARRYGLEPFRRRGQRRTSIMVSAPPGFIRGTLIPEFDECNSVLIAHLDALAARIIEETLATDSSEPEERRELR
ncbi:MAG TPA: hypothetical protein VF701_07660 [Thermoanaerobaculia bacterium]